MYRNSVLDIHNPVSYSVYVVNLIVNLNIP